jgi:hypothetical protein
MEYIHLWEVEINGKNAIVATNNMESYLAYDAAEMKLGEDAKTANTLSCRYVGELGQTIDDEGDIAYVLPVED